MVLSCFSVNLINYYLLPPPPLLLILLYFYHYASLSLKDYIGTGRSSSRLVGTAKADRRKDYFNRLYWGTMDAGSLLC